ncbi:MAG: cobalamin-dependent protein [Bacteroidetes bacterium]|nr:cobalamin-dependent protein [Bacteroidota bacterium]MDA1121121.1 cobalamin-dependent protein [Bacteroidota bacterium]
MKILLVSPAVDPDTRTNKELMMPQLALYILDGLTPPDHEVTVVEEEAEEINFKVAYDIVGISCMTANAPRAYELADQFRRRGITVIIGGVHPTILPQEALPHADSVVIGEAEGVWVKILEDFQKGQLKETYHQPYPDLKKYDPKDFKKIIKEKTFQPRPINDNQGMPL